MGVIDVLVSPRCRSAVGLSRRGGSRGARACSDRSPGLPAVAVFTRLFSEFTVESPSGALWRCVVCVAIARPPDWDSSV